NAGRMAVSNLDLGKVSLRGVDGDPCCRPQADLPGGELLHDDHGAAATRTRPSGTGGRRYLQCWGLHAGCLRQKLAASCDRLSPPGCGQKTEVTDAHQPTWQSMQEKAA